MAFKEDVVVQGNINPNLPDEWIKRDDTESSFNEMREDNLEVS
jgi:hypothetical protein